MGVKETNVGWSHKKGVVGVQAEAMELRVWGEGV